MPSTPKQPKLPPTVFRLGWISFFADVASEMAYPVLPIFLRSVLGAPLAALGLVEGIAEAIVSFMKGWSGWHSDKTGRRAPFIQWGYGLSAAGKPLLALATAWPAVLGARSLDRLGKGLRTTARDALIADAVDGSQYGRAFGFHRAMDTAGALIGVLIALLLLELIPEGYRTIFALAAIPGAISLVLALGVRDKRRGIEEQRDSEGLEGSEGIERSIEDGMSDKTSPWTVLRALPAGYWRALIVTLVFALANSSDTFLLIRAKDLGLSAVQVVLAYAAYNVTYTLISYPAGVLSDRIGRWRVLAGGWLLYVGVYAGFAYTGAGGLWPLFALYGLYIGLTQGVTKALVADHAPKDAKGTALGFFYFSSGFATLAGSLMMGLLWDFYSAKVAFLTAAGLAAVAVLLIPLTRVKRVAVP